MAKTLCADVDEDCLAELCNVNTALLEVCLTAYFSRVVELRSAGTVRVAAPYLGRFSGDFASACHSAGRIAWGSREGNLVY